MAAPSNSNVETKPGAVPSSPLLANLYIAWWVATTMVTAGLLVQLPDTLSFIASPRRFTVMILLTAGWVAFSYGVGKWVDRRTVGRFSEGYPPFQAPAAAVLWFLAAAAGCVIVPLELWSSGDGAASYGESMFRASIGLAVWLAVCLATRMLIKRSA